MGHYAKSSARALSAYLELYQVLRGMSDVRGVRHYAAAVPAVANARGAMAFSSAAPAVGTKQLFELEAV